MFTAWWFPFSRFGVIHGDPHLGNYTVFSRDGEPAGINLLDYGCIRIFAPKFVQGVVDLYHGLLREDRDLIVHAYETWGFRRLSNDLVETLNIWARFIFGPFSTIGFARSRTALRRRPMVGARPFACIRRSSRKAR